MKKFICTLSILLLGFLLTPTYAQVPVPAQDNQSVCFSPTVYAVSNYTVVYKMNTVSKPDLQVFLSLDTTTGRIEQINVEKEYDKVYKYILFEGENEPKDKPIKNTFTLLTTEQPYIFTLFNTTTGDIRMLKWNEHFKWTYCKRPVQANETGIPID